MNPHSENRAPPPPDVSHVPGHSGLSRAQGHPWSPCLATSQDQTHQSQIRDAPGAESPVRGRKEAAPGRCSDQFSPRPEAGLFHSHPPEQWEVPLLPPRNPFKEFIADSSGKSQRKHLPFRPRGGAQPCPSSWLFSESFLAALLLWDRACPEPSGLGAQARPSKGNGHTLWQVAGFHFPSPSTEDMELLSCCRGR